MKRLKKGKKVLAGLIAAAVLIFLGISGYRQYERSERERIITTPFRPLTEDEKIEDMAYLYKTILENYPYLEVNKRLNGVDWAAQKEEYTQRVRQTQNDEEFFNVLQDIVGQLNNGHTQMISSKKQIEDYRYLYYQMKQKGAWQGLLYDILNKPMVLRRYRVADQVPQIPAKEGRMSLQNEEEILSVDENVTVKDVIEGEVAYVQIKQMLNPWNADRDKEILTSYFNRVKDYPALIIDIRGNGGGDTSYWQNFLVPYLTNRELSVTQYGFYKDGELDNAVLNAKGLLKYRRNKVSDLNLKELPNLPPEIADSFSYYVLWQTDLKPDEEGISFNGNIYLLVDKGVYSASEAFAAFSKDSGFALLIGERTGGDGIGEDPVFTVLPNSGYVVRFSLEMGTSQYGTCDEECKTIPDYIAEPGMQKDFMKDACIQKALALEGKSVN